MKKRRVLVVDDEMDMRIFISTLLETNGYEPVVAVDGNEGIQKALEHKPAAIIMDVLMPKEGGLEMYRAVKTDGELKHTPVIVISAIAKRTFHHSLRLLNNSRGEAVPQPEAYIEKPPEIEEVLENLKLCLNSAGQIGKT